MAARVAPLVAQPRGLLVAAAVASVAFVPLTLRAPMLALALPAGVLALVAVARLDPRYAIAGVLAFLPVQELVVSHAPGPAALAVRYGPELVLDVLLLVVVARRPAEIWRRLGPIALPLGALLAFWILTALWNALPASTAVVGLRSELRFLPLLVLPLVARHPRRDARLYAQVIVFSAAAQAVVALVELVGGPGVRSALAPRYDLVLGGVSVGKAGPPLDSIFGTFGNRNLLGLFLALAWIILAAAGSREVGLRPRVGLAVGWLIVVAVVGSASREGAIALAVGAGVVGIVRWGRSLVRMALFASAAFVLAGLWLAPVAPSASLIDSGSVFQRWQSVFTPVAWQPDTNFRLRLLINNAKLAASDAPLFGYGIGTATDPRLLADFSSPVYRSFPGLERAVLPFLSDGNWAILVIEAGFTGLALLALLLSALIALGLATRDLHWAGLALAAVVPAVLVLGFFTSALQQRPASAVLWLLVGLTLAVRSRWEGGVR